VIPTVWRFRGPVYDQLTETYNTNYERYLEEYTNTLIETYTMKVSMAAFM
ncbi:TPA: hypothetical protein MNN59_005798, partial [Citrobacter freundii]|nr:hypothetical protein [Citrobacter freundii]HBZ9384374.1 hypothetical protein [Citrobacter freundii]HCA2035179.1 hypothetical protein [Citrobacter freundii]HCA2857855.1 hypothetical protein [Citrobacter freundii]